VQRCRHNLVPALSIVGLFFSLIGVCLSPISGTLIYGSLLGYYQGINPIFWFGYAVIILAIIVSFHDKDASFGSLLPFFAFFWVFFFTPTLRENLPRHLDAWYMLGMSKEIANQGHIPLFNSVTEKWTIYYKWPGFFTFSSMMKLITGIDFFTTSESLSIVLSFFFPLTWYVAIKKLTSNAIELKLSLLVFLLTFMFIGSPQFSPQYFALVLYPLVIVLWLENGSRSTRVIAILLTFLVTVIHPISSTILLCMLLAIVVAQRLIRRDLGGSQRKENGYLLLLAVIFFFFWNFYYSSAYSFETLISQTKNYLATLLLQNELKPLTQLLMGSPPNVSLWYERFTRYFPIFLAVVGLFLLLRTKRNRSRGLLLGSLLIGTFLAFPIIFVTSGQWWDRFFEFAALPVAVLASAALFKVYHSKHRAIFFAIILSLTLLVSFKFIITYNEPVFIHTQQELTLGVFTVSHVGNSSSLLTDYKTNTVLYFLDPVYKLYSKVSREELQAKSYDLLLMNGLSTQHVNSTLIGELDNRLYDSGSCEIYSRHLK